MSEQIELREWQRRAITGYRAAACRDFLVVATPGAGKTLLAAAIAREKLDTGDVERVIVVTPTEHLKKQWAGRTGLHRLGIDVDPRWESATGALPRDMHGVAVTYAQVAMSPPLFRLHTSKARTMVIFDEIHHCGTTRAWGDAIAHAFEPAASRLSLSGTPFRSDNNEIPFVRYVDGVGQADFTYDYGAAMRHGVCRSVYFPRFGGRMEWVSPKGGVRAATFEDDLDQEAAGQRLRTALDLRGEWLRAVISDAHRQLEELRNEDRDAGGLVIAMDQDHARGIAEILTRVVGHAPYLVVSDDPGASGKLSAFSEGSAAWIVAVKMVSEGVDIPRLRVAVYATNVSTELYFRQAVGRIVRCERDHEDHSGFFFIPDDARLRAYAATIQEQRDHELEDGDRRLFNGEQGFGDEGQGALFSQFMPISSSAVSSGVTSAGEIYTPEELRRAEEIRSALPEARALAAPVLARVLRMGMATDGGSLAREVPEAAAPKCDRKKTLRERNHAAARRIGSSRNVKHEDVNTRLNALVGVRTVKDATEAQLERRLELALEWLTKGEAPSAC